MSVRYIHVSYGGKQSKFKRVIIIIQRFHLMVYFMSLVYGNFKIHIIEFNWGRF